MNRADRKRYRDRDRYLQMTPSQREAYLQRNREYKRAKRDSNASGSSAQSTTGQTNVSYNDNIDMLMESSLVTEDCCMHSSVVDQQGCSSNMKQVATFGTFEISESGKQYVSDSDHRIFIQSNMCHLDNETRLTVSSSGVHGSSTSLNDQAADIALTNSG